MAKKDIGEMKRAAGFQNTFWTMFVDEVEAIDGDAVRLYSLDEEGIRKAAKAAAIAVVATDGTLVQPFTLTVNRRRSRAEMVAAGRYDYAHPGITEENFPVGEGEAEVEAVLLHLNRSASNEMVLAEIDRLGLRPATMDELLAFGEQYPDRQRQFPIVALGSVWAHRHGGRRVGYLWGGRWRAQP